MGRRGEVGEGAGGGEREEGGERGRIEGRGYRKGY